MNLLLRLKSQPGGKRRDFKALKDTEVSEAHDRKFKEALAQSEVPTSIDEKWKRLNNYMTSAQESIPVAEKKSQHRWNTSAETLLHVKEREERWEEMSVNERKRK